MYGPFAEGAIFYLIKIRKKFLILQIIIRSELMNTETSLKTSDLGDLSKETYLTSQQKEDMKKMAEVAKQAAKESIEALRKELKDKPYYTRKDIEIFLKYKERYDDALQGIMLLQEQLD